MGPYGHVRAVGLIPVLILTQRDNKDFSWEFLGFFSYIGPYGPLWAHMGPAQAGGRAVGRAVGLLQEDTTGLITLNPY